MAADAKRMSPCAAGLITSNRRTSRGAGALRRGKKAPSARPAAPTSGLRNEAGMTVGTSRASWHAHSINNRALAQQERRALGGGEGPKSVMAEPRDVPLIDRRLREAFGVPRRRAPVDPVEELVATVLSQHTAGSNS